MKTVDPSTKILTAEQLRQRCAAWRREGKTIVTTNGAFDVIHHGHISSIRHAALLGDILVVGINSDASVKRYKSTSRPFQSQEHRALQIACLPWVDAVHVFDEDNPIRFLRDVVPHVHCKGSEYRTRRPMIEEAPLEEMGARVEFLPVEEGLSTTELSRKIFEEQLSQLPPGVRTQVIVHQESQASPSSPDAMQGALEAVARAAPRLRIAVIGDVMLDENLSGNVSRISPEAPIMVMCNEERRILPGGAANVARNIAASGAHCHIISLVGDDGTADELSALLRRENLSTTFVKDPTRPTIVKTRFWGTGHGAPHQLFRVDTERIHMPAPDVSQRLLGAIRSLRPRPDTEGFDAIVLSDYAKGTVSEQVIRAAIDTGIKVIAAPKPVRGQLFKGVDVLVPNKSEALAITGLNVTMDMRLVAQSIQSILGGGKLPPQVVITLGKDGIMGLDRDGKDYHQHAVARELADVVGAGDTALALLVVCLCAGASLEHAIRIANLAAGIKVGKRGVATVTFDEMRAALV